MSQQWFKHQGEIKTNPASKLNTKISNTKMTTALNELESTVKREMDEGSRIRGGGEKGFYED